jgi:hypothetical protein
MADLPAISLGLVFGFGQGVRHAFEPDHVVAVSTMMSRAAGVRARVGYAMAWGLGHAAILVVVGAVLMTLRAELPARLDAAFELAVALMLIALGARAVRHAIREARRDDAHVAHAAHAHGDAAHRGWRSLGPVAMGMIHGLAGSGALTALVVARLPSPLVGALFLALFGAGATIGMSLLAGAAGVPLERLVRTRWGMPALLGVTGGLSLLLGLVWIGPAAMRLATATG